MLDKLLDFILDMFNVVMDLFDLCIDIATEISKNHQLLYLLPIIFVGWFILKCYKMVMIGSKVVMPVVIVKEE